MSKIEVALAWFDKNGKTLSVSRKDNHNDLGFPGGKLDAGEIAEQALIREVFEETGLTITKYKLIDIRLYHNKIIHLFLIQDYVGEISTQETGLVSWVNRRDMYSSDCSFRDYNYNIFEKFD